MICFIALGSNLGDKKKNCQRAVGLLKTHPQIQVLKISKWRKTKAVTLNNEPQPDYINGVTKIETHLPPLDLFRLCKQIERELGRTPPSRKWEPRIIDLDILFYGDQIIETPELKIPHPLLHQRLFVLEPLREIAPDFVHPILKKEVARFYQDMLIAQK